MNVGERIKARRIELGISQDELAKMCGYAGRSAVSKIETSEDVSIKKLKKIIEPLQTTWEYLLGLESESNILDDVDIKSESIMIGYRRLTPQNQKIIENMIDMLLEQQEQ